MLDAGGIPVVVVGVGGDPAERIRPGEEPVVAVEGAVGDTAQRISLRDGLEPGVEVVDLGRAEGVRVPGDTVARLGVGLVRERGREVAVRADRTDDAARVVVHVEERGVVAVGPGGDPGVRIVREAKGQPGGVDHAAEVAQSVVAVAHDGDGAVGGAQGEFAHPGVLDSQGEPVAPEWATAVGLPSPRRAKLMRLWLRSSISLSQ